MKKKTGLVLVFSLCLSLVPVLSLAARINGKAPDFTLRDINGKAFSLTDFRGKVVFIDFWASWCAPCKKELPEVSKFSRKYGNDVVFIAINVDKRRANAEDFLLQIPGLSPGVKVLLDNDSTVVSSYNVAAMPTSFILDKEGVVRYVHFGFRESDPESWTEEIDKLLKQESRQ